MKTPDSERFANRYSASGQPADLAAEFDALGSDYQANGYTTRSQAHVLGDALRLGPESVLLDIGSGCGWPGLYLAERHGCSVVSLDPIEEGSRTTHDRAVADGMSERTLSIQGDGEAIPLRPGSVDAVVHGDVLC